jgi:hypothetical protein
LTPSGNASATLPPELTIRPGTFVQVRINEGLSSDHNRAGDSFTATLDKPIIVDGYVVAERGQTIAGRVVEAEKASHGNKSRLAIELGELTLVDGNQVPIRSTLASFSQGRPVGRDVATVGATTATGAAIGGIANYGTGAAIGAVVGAMAGMAAVMLTPGRPTEIYPESLLTFRVEDPVTIPTDRAPQAFRPVTRADYDASAPPRPPARSGPPVPPPPPYYGPYYAGPVYPYPYLYPYPYYYGPTIYFGISRYGYRGYRHWH